MQCRVREEKSLETKGARPGILMFYSLRREPLFEGFGEYQCLMS